MFQTTRNTWKLDVSPARKGILTDISKWKLRDNKSVQISVKCNQHMHEYMKAGIVTSKTTSFCPAIMRPGPSDCQQISADGYKSWDVTIQRKSHGFQLNRGKEGIRSNKTKEIKSRNADVRPLTSKPSFFLANLRMKWWIWGVHFLWYARMAFEYL